MNQVKWKSPVLWASVVAQVVALLILLKVIDIGLGDTINLAVGMVLQILVTLGVLNNPNDAKKF